MREFVICFHASKLLSESFIWPEIPLFFLSHLANSYTSFKIHLNCHLLQEAFCPPTNSWFRWLLSIFSQCLALIYSLEVIDFIYLFFCQVVYNFSHGRRFILFNSLPSKSSIEPSSLFYILSCSKTNWNWVNERPNQDFKKINNLK